MITLVHSFTIWSHHKKAVLMLRHLWCSIGVLNYLINVWMIVLDDSTSYQYLSKEGVISHVSHDPSASMAPIPL